jgi:hypothetical protein
MNKFPLHKAIKLAGQYENKFEFCAKHDYDVPARYRKRAYYADAEREYASVRIGETIWYYAHNPSIETLLDLFRGTADEFAKAYGLPPELVSRWESGAEKPPEYLLELLLSEMLHDWRGDYYLNPEEFDYSFFPKIDEDEAVDYIELL